jgi:hypothetical protein
MAQYDDYVPQSRLAQWREENIPPHCPILGHEELIPVVDHDHKSGRIRAVMSSEGNALLGKIENFHKSRCIHGKWDLPTVLRAMADYLERDQGPLHPVGTRQLTKRFGRGKKPDQVAILESVGATESEIEACTNSKDRTNLYRSKIVK